MKKYTINLDITIDAKNEQEATDKLFNIINEKYHYIIGEIQDESCYSCGKIPDTFGRCKCCNKDCF